MPRDGKCSAADKATHRADLLAKGERAKVWGPVQFSPTCEVDTQFGPGGSEIGFSATVATDDPGYQQ